MGFRVQGLGFRVWGLGFGVWGLGFCRFCNFGAWGLGFILGNQHIRFGACWGFLKRSVQ